MAPQIIPQCSDQFPFILLPVRLETKYQRSAGGTELRIRFYPDAISVAPPPVAVNEAERMLGQGYWKARAAVRQAPNDDNLKRAYKGSWNALATRAGAYRAGFVVRNTASLNPDAAPGDLTFPPPPPPSPTPLPRADGLPDSFLVIAYFRDPTTRVQSEVARVTGAPIPTDLLLGPDPTQSVVSLSRDPATGRLVVSDSLRWLVDFDAAVQVGMAVRMPVAPPFDTRGFDRIVALGIRATSSFPDGSGILEQLFQKHRDSDGFALVPAGTPTNNTETAPSEWQPASSQVEELFAIEDNPPDLNGNEGSMEPKDGQRFADLFMFSTEFVRRLPGAAATDISEALAFNRAATPGTIGDFMREYLKGWVDTLTADAVHDFFATWVTGRGQFPAFRAGRQPYGIVVTSSWSDWKSMAATPISIPSSDITHRILNLLMIHRPRWEVLADRVPHAALPTSDPFQRLLGILGLLASSTDFVSRKAVSDEYIRQRLQFAGANAPATQAWLNALIQSRAASFGTINFPPAPGPSDPLLAFIVFLEQFDEWKLPLIDGDPAKPLSETGFVAKYDGTHTYLDWLTTASSADLSSQAFKDAAGNAIPAPAALLYVLLRQSLLAALENSSLEVARVQGQGTFDVPDRDPPIANIGDQQNVLRKDYLDLDASRLGLSTQPIALVDWVLGQARAGSASSVPPVQRLAEVQQAIAALAGSPTARLERLLAEHIDLCCYRLAWITGLYTHRFATMRQQADVRGLYLGAYGFVENVRPSTGQLQPVPPESLPALLRAGVTSDVFEDPTNAGYIHAPSVMQAGTAAVLRNGYLSHASSDQPLLFSVNLSSARMRAASLLMDGVRNGQPLAALLGYQFERGLHEGHPGIELDSFIYLFRDQFPLLGGRLTELPPNTSAEVVEARNVVDGLGLLQAASQAYPYGLAGLPALPNPAASAIITEVDRLKDALDAVSDLLLSESVYQVVQGNTPRLQGTLQAWTSPEAPPEPEILRTPRSGRLFSFRVSIALDPDGAAGWFPTLSSRARANAQVNHWLTSHLPAARSIQWTVQAPGGGPAVQSLRDLRLEPLDLVLMSGDRLGDQSSELERYLIRQYRWENAIPNSIPTVIAQSGGTAPDPQHSLIFDWGAASTGSNSLASVQPLLLRWRRLITQARPMHAGDWRRTTGPQGADPADPSGSATGNPRLLQFADLVQRLDAAIQALADAASHLSTATDALVASAANLDTNPAILANPAFHAKIEALTEALFGIELFGIPEANPVDTLPLDPVVVRGLLSQAQVVLQIAKDRSSRATTLRQTTFSDPLPTIEPARTKELARRNDILRRSYLDAGKAIFGPAFIIVPLYRLPSNEISEIQQAAANPAVADPLVVQEWLHSTSRVRPPVADMMISLAAARWLGHPIEDPALLQLPHQPGRSWIGGPIDPALPPGDWLSMVLWNAALIPKPLQAGLILDAWTETVPASRETTGVAFHYNRPNATAPQAVLLAVPATQLGHWTWDGLIGSVHEALDLAKIRGVEPDALIGRGPNSRPPEGAYFQTLPAILSEMTRTRFAATDYANVVVGAVQTNV